MNETISLKDQDESAEDIRYVTVIKVGGNELDDEAFLAGLVSAVGTLKAQGHFPVIVHGGGKAIAAYERLLMDVFRGDPALFMRRDAVETSWQWIQPLLDAWERGNKRWLPEYPACTWGPVEADRLIEDDGRRWRVL